jgi:hypothetical protein
LPSHVLLASTDSSKLFLECNQGKTNKKKNLIKKSKKKSHKKNLKKKKKTARAARANERFEIASILPAVFFKPAFITTLTRHGLGKVYQGK